MVPIIKSNAEIGLSIKMGKRDGSEIPEAQLIYLKGD